MSYLNVPNILTTARLMLAPLIPVALFLEINPFSFMLHADYRTGVLLLALMVGFTDYLDGRIAKLWDQETEFGKWLDPIADCMYCTSLYLTTLIIYRHVPMLVTLWVMMGGYFVCYAWAVSDMRRKNLIDKPNWYAKAFMCVLMISLLIVFLSSVIHLHFALGTWQFEFIGDMLAIMGALTAVTLAGESLDRYKNDKPIH